MESTNRQREESSCHVVRDLTNLSRLKEAVGLQWPSKPSLGGLGSQAFIIA